MISIPAAPIFARLYSEEKYAELRFSALICAILCALFASVFLMLITFSYEKLFELLAWEDFQQFNLLILLGLCQLANCIFGPIFHLLNMSGNSKIVAVIQLSSIFMNICGNAIMFYFYGYYGIAMSTLFCTVIQQTTGLVAVKIFLFDRGMLSEKLPETEA